MPSRRTTAAKPRRKPSTVDVIIPTAGDCPHRAAALAWVTGHYALHHYSWTVTVAETGQPFSKGAAVNPVAAASTADVLVIADADSWVAPSDLAAAVERAKKAGWAMPHATVRRIDAADTARILAGEEVPDPSLEVPAAQAVPGGGIAVFTRQAWDTHGGFDERFTGWGREDATLALVGGQRLGHFWARDADGPLWHLWHPRPAPDQAQAAAGELLYQRYLAAARDPAALAAIIAERAT